MIYLDNAATGFPKPPAVWREQESCMRYYCGNPGRGSHRLSLQAAEKIYQCREEIASLFGSGHPEQVIFTMNATVALNMAIKGLLRRGDHVLISDLEHNAVYRPICRLAHAGIITYDVFPSLALSPERTEEKLCHAIEGLIRPNTKMLIANHASNICSVTLPATALGELCHRHGLYFVLDASQSAGHLPIHMEQMQISALCAPGHKGLFGPQGSGFLLLGDGVCAETLLEGGSGVNSLDPEMPQDPPERYEAGTLPTPAIAGLCEGIKFVKQVGVSALCEHESTLNRRLLDRLQTIPSLTVCAPHACGSILLFHSPTLPADRLGQALDHRGICVRSGFHCAPLAHRTLQTPSTGAVRVSPGFFNTPADIDTLWRAVREIFAE